MAATSKTSHWILLRGLAREARHWNDFPEKLTAALAAQGETARVDALDMPGAGRFSEMKAPLTIGETTEFLREKFAEIRRKQRDRGETPSERTRIMAVSMGGMIATDWLERWPDDFEECILINTSFSGFSPARHRLTPQAWLHIAGTLRHKNHVDRFLHEFKLIANTMPEDQRKKTAEAWGAYFNERPFTIENFSRQLVASARFRAPTEKPSAPVLVLSSSHDRMVSPECSKEIVRRWKTDSAVHPSAGHDLTLDDSDWVIEKTLAWERKLKEIPAHGDSLRSHG